MNQERQLGPPAFAHPPRARRRRLWRLLAEVALALPIAAAPALGASSPYPQSTAITGISFRWDTHRQLAEGADNWALTWSADGHQYAAYGDGGGFEGTEALGRASLGVARIEGTASAYRGRNVWGGFDALAPATFPGKSYGMLALGTDLYMWRCGAGSGATAFDFQQLHKSTDGGRSWRAASWIFPRGITFYCPTFLQFGKGYAGARDGYVYMYASERNGDGWQVQKPGRIALMRAPAAGLLDREAYEFLVGLDATGAPRWSREVEERAPAFEDANGARLVSVAHNPGLDRYLLVTEHGQKGTGDLGIFDAPEPWGPWTTVLYADGWSGGRVPAEAFFANFATKWWGDKGKSFVLVFTGKGSLDSWNSVEGSFLTGAIGGTGSGAANGRRTPGDR